MNNIKKGFTLIELTIVTLIITILSVVLMPQVSSVVNKAKSTGVVMDFHEFQIAASIVAHEDSGFNRNTAVTRLNQNLDSVCRIGNSSKTFQSDPWNTQYSYQFIDGTSEHGDMVQLISCGPDQQLGTEDDLFTAVEYTLDRRVVIDPSDEIQIPSEGDPVPGEPTPTEPEVVLPEGVMISPENFPDPTFREYVEWIEKQPSIGNGDGVLTEEEISRVTKIEIADEVNNIDDFKPSISNGKVNDLHGIEHFTSVKFIECDDDEVGTTTIDIRGLGKLEVLEFETPEGIERPDSITIIVDASNVNLKKIIVERGCKNIVVVQGKLDLPHPESLKIVED